jgi:DNA-binding transcriptional ArsR family regulator
MVEYKLSLDNIFSALADPTRRDILRRVALDQLSISQIATDYNLTFAAVSKHIMFLERAKLIIKKRVGRRQFVRANPDNLKDAAEYLDWYKGFMGAKLDALEMYLREEQQNGRN